MSVKIDPVILAQTLVACPSVTPARGRVFDILEEVLLPMGFDVHRFVLGEEPDGPTENMVAIRGSHGRHFGFAGHLDVVPPGDGWDGDPFDAAIENGVLTGRGACDMKSAIAAFVAANRGEAITIPDSVRDMGSKDVYAIAQLLVPTCSMLGDIDEALKWLERGVELGYINYPMVSDIDPFLENLRRDPRSKKLMERIK